MTTQIELENGLGLLTTEDASAWLLLEEDSMATLATQTIKRAGVGPTYAAAAVGGDRFVPGAHTFLHVKNGGGSSVNVTVSAPATVDGDLTIASVVVAVPAAGERMLGPFPSQVFTAHDGTGLASVAYSAVTSVTVAALTL